MSHTYIFNKRNRINAFFFNRIQADVSFLCEHLSKNDDFICFKNFFNITHPASLLCVDFWRTVIHGVTNKGWARGALHPKDYFCKGALDNVRVL